MSNTNVLVETLAKALGESDPNRLADALRTYGLGLHLSPQKWTWLGTTGATSVAINTASFLAGASPGAKTPALPQGLAALPAALGIETLRVTTGPSGSVGAYGVVDSGGTAQLPPLAGPSGAQVTTFGTALISDDGATITFPTNVSGFVIEYIPRSLVDVTAPNTGF